MSGGKKRSGFQITSVTSDFKHTPNDQSPRSNVLTDLTSKASTCSLQGSSSQPTTPSLKRKYVSHETSAQDAACSRFRVVRLAVAGSGGGGRGKLYHRGRWTCTEFMEWQEGVGFRRVLDTMRHAHSLESLEMIGREAGRGEGDSPGTAHLLSQPIPTKDGSGVVLHSGPPSPTHNQPVSTWLLDCREPGEDEQLDSRPSSPPGRPPALRLPVQLEQDRVGQVQTHVSGEISTRQRQHCPVCLSASTSSGCLSPSPVLPPLDPTTGLPGPQQPLVWIKPSLTCPRTPGNRSPPVCTVTALMSSLGCWTCPPDLWRTVMCPQLPDCPPLITNTHG